MFNGCNSVQVRHADKLSKNFISQKVKRWCCVSNFCYWGLFFHNLNNKTRGLFKGTHECKLNEDNRGLFDQSLIGTQYQICLSAWPCKIFQCAQSVSLNYINNLYFYLFICHDIFFKVNIYFYLHLKSLQFKKKKKSSVKHLTGAWCQGVT